MARNDPGGVLAELDEAFIRRMRNWALGRCGSSMGFAQVDWDIKGSSGYAEAHMPVMTGEADDTDRALQTLLVRYRRAVELFWAWEQTELTVLAQKCGGIDYRTYVTRVKEGHAVLRAELARRADAARQERTRVEQAIEYIKQHARTA